MNRFPCEPRLFSVRQHVRRFRRRLGTCLLGPALVAGLLMPVPVAAQQPRSGQQARDVDRELAATMEQFMVLRMTKFLELSDEQADKVAPLVKDLARSRRQHGHQRREAIRALVAMAQDPGTDDAMIEQRLKRFHQDQNAFRQRQEELVADIGNHLDVRQQARLLAFEERFREDVRQRVEDARGGGPGMNRRRPPNRQQRH